METKKQKQKYERMILMMDANEDINKRELERALTQLGMWDSVKENTGQKGPETHLRGKNKIDGIWSTKDIDCHAARFIPLWSGIGDYRACVMDIP